MHINLTPIFRMRQHRHHREQSTVPAQRANDEKLAHARLKRQAGESFAVAKLKHGRAADLIIYLVFIHAFLGFIYTFDVLM